MGSITSLKCVLTQEHLDAICAKYFVPEEVHPQLPSSDATMHERPTGKIGMYTRFFDYANYRIPFSTFFVSVLTHFRIPFSQLSVFGSAKDNVEPTVPITEPVETEIPVPKRSKKKRVTRGSERMPAASHPPKRLRADYGTTGGSATGAFLPYLYYFLRDKLHSGGGGETVTDSVWSGPSLRTVGPSARFVVLSDSSHHSGAKSADPEVDSLVRSAAPVMTEATTVATIATTIAIPADVSKDKSAPHPSIFGSSSSSEKTGRTLSLFTGRSGSGFDAGSIRAEEAMGTGLEEIYVPEWTVTKGFELNDGRLCANMIDHFTPPAFFKTVRGMEHEQLFTEFNVLAARNLSLSSEAKEESVEVAQLRAQVSILEATKNSLRGEVASTKEHNVLLEQECDSLKLKVHELEISSTDLREKLEMYEGNLKQLDEYQDDLMRPLKTRLAEIDADFTSCCMLLQCLNSTEYMEALGHAFGRAIEKGMQEGLAAGIEHGQAGRCLTDLEAYIPSAEADFNSAIRDLRDLNFPLLQELSNKKDASTWDIMDLLRLDDAVAETLGMTDLQPDVEQLMISHGKICCWKTFPPIFDMLCLVSIDDPLSAEALIEPPVEVPATNVLSTVVIVPHSGPSVSVEDYDNPDSVNVFPKNVTPGPEGEGKVDASNGG
ncbi:hypothetical protein Tco_0164426 [Tanacetum coccineum]